MATPRTTRAEKKAATRERLLAAATRIATHHGFAGISLERVAEEAGLTKGAIYSNFTSKDELLLEVAERLSPGLNFSEQVVESESLGELLEFAAAALVQASRARRKEVALAAEFEALAIRDTRLKRAMLASRRSEDLSRDPVWAWIEAHRDEFPLPPEQFIEVVNAVGWGLLVRRLLYGAGALPDDVIAWTLTRLLSEGTGSSA